MKTIQATGVMFWTGILCVVVAVAAFLKVSPGETVDVGVPELLVPAMNLYGDALRYGAFFAGALGIVYILVGWQRARREALNSRVA